VLLIILFVVLAGHSAGGEACFMLLIILFVVLAGTFRGHQLIWRMGVWTSLEALEGKMADPGYPGKPWV
jgi:hypothetical protein